MTRTTLAIPAAFAAGAILFSLGASVAGQTNVVDTTKIRACVNTAGSPRFLAAGVTTCRSGERLVEWNAQGLAGAAGPIGPVGPAGLKGAKGDKGDKGEPGLDSQRAGQGFFDVFPEIGRVGFLDVPPGTTSADGAAVVGPATDGAVVGAVVDSSAADSVAADVVSAVVDPIVERKVYGFTTGEGLSDADADNDGMLDRVAAGDVSADGFGPVGIDLAVDGSRPSLAEAAASRHTFRAVTLFVEADMDGDGVIHAADAAGTADEGLVLLLENARIIRHGFAGGTDFLGGRRHDAAMSSIGNIRARTATVDAQGPTILLEHVELDFERITWIAQNAGTSTTLGRWDVREGHAD